MTARTFADLSQQLLSAQITGRPRALAPQQDAQIRKLHALGYDLDTIAARFRVDRATIRRRLGPERQSQRLPQSYTPAAAPPRMIVTPWFIDPADGLATRVVKAE